MQQKHKGQDLSEWALVVALVCVVVMSLLVFGLDTNIKNISNIIVNALNQVNTGNIQNP